MAKTSSKVKKLEGSKVEDLRKMSLDELQKALQTGRKDLLEAQKSLKADELANPHAVKKLRKEIARIMTVMTEMNNNSNNNDPVTTSDADGEGLAKARKGAK